jgi:hypothetical protein
LTAEKTIGIVEVAVFAATAGGETARREEYDCPQADEISRQRGQSVVMTFRPAKCDHDILSLDKSSFA